MAEKLQDLRALSDEELIRRHDAKAPDTRIGTDHYLTELARRDQDRQTQAVLRYTAWVTWMTIIITIATVINLGIFIWSVFR